MHFRQKNDHFRHVMKISSKNIVIPIKSLKKAKKGKNSTKKSIVPIILSFDTPLPY